MRLALLFCFCSALLCAQQTIDLGVEELRDRLNRKSGTVELPLPGGGKATFTATYDPVMEPALAARYPRLASYRVVGPWGTGRIALSHKGIDALLPGPDGTFALEPAGSADRHALFYTHEHTPGVALGPLDCGYDPSDPLNVHKGAGAGAVGREKSSAVARNLHEYDLALTNTGEFASEVGGSKEDVLAAFNTTVSTMNAIFEREIGIRVNLLAISEDLIYLDPATDPFFDADEGSGLLNQVIEAFNANNIPENSYDLGHVLTQRCTDVGGVVSGRACSSSKTRGVTCLQGGNVARTAERVMAHEIAHQFGVSHSWNNCPPSQEQRAGGTAFEPGSGTTIMSYAGACGDQNVGRPSAYYHLGSLEQFQFYTRQGGAAGCATIIETDNQIPEASVDYPENLFIPHSTPFRLTGTASDANDDEDRLTYTWEQYDTGPATSINDPEGTAPTFRSVPPSPNGNTRFFPRLDRVANNILSNEEVLPAYARQMTFRLTVRDNNEEAGAYDWAEVAFRTTDQGPFTVNDPGPDFGGTAPTVWRVGDFREVTWNVAGTDQAPVLARRVNILLSGDGGLSFDRVLAENVANTGSAFVTVPDTLGETMRIVIEAADNIFYNMNATDFAIEQAERATYTFESDLRYQNVCLPETVEANLSVGSVLDFDAPVRIAIDSTQTLPAGLELTLADSELMPGESTTLRLDLSDLDTTGRITIPYIVSADGADTTRREIILDVTSNDFSDLIVAGPVEGTEGIVLTTDFDWTEARNATSYDVQIATSPSFAPGTIFEQAEGLVTTEFTPEEFFAPNSLYFWRVRPNNSCGAGEWLEPTSFRTVASRCDVYEGGDTPLSLPGSGGSFSREAKLFVDRRGAINDLNIPNITLGYQFVSGVTLSLTSPAGTKVTLYEENCFSTNALNLGFDDEAPLAVACPPDDQRVFQPKDSLAAFIGEDTFGEWVLTIEVSETNSAAGQLSAWQIEFCADAEAPTPDVLVNDSTAVKPAGRNPVIRQVLEVVSEEDTDDETFFILTRMPKRGLLELRGNQLMVGDIFTQADINARRLVYENQDTSLMTDDFGFVVTTQTGGYLPVSYHDIVITQDAVNSIGDGPDRLVTSLDVFPNPTAGDVQLRWSTRLSGEVDVELYDLNGRTVLQRRVALSAGQARISTTDLPAGIYVLRIDDAVRRIVKR